MACHRHLMGMVIQDPYTSTFRRTPLFSSRLFMGLMETTSQQFLHKCTTTPTCPPLWLLCTPTIPRGQCLARRMDTPQPIVFLHIRMFMVWPLIRAFLPIVPANIHMGHALDRE